MNKSGFLSLIIVAAMLCTTVFNVFATTDISFSEPDEIVVNDFGAAPNNTALDQTVKLLGYSTAKWDTSSKNGNPLYINGTYNVDANTYLYMTIYNPTNTIGKKIGIYLANGTQTPVTNSNGSKWDADVGKHKDFTLSKKGWNVVCLKVGDFENGYGTVTADNYKTVQIHNKQWGGNFLGEECPYLNIGKIWFSKTAAEGNFEKEITPLQKDEFLIGSSSNWQIDKYSGLDNVYKFTFEYKAATAASAEKLVYANFEMKDKDGTYVPSQPIWMSTDTNWHTFSFKIPEKFNMNDVHIKAANAISSLRDEGKILAKDANIEFTIKNFKAYTSPYGNSITKLSHSDKMFVSDYAYIAASSAICAGKDAIVTVKNSSGTAVSSSYDIIQNKILIDFEKSAGTTYTIEYSGFYDIAGNNEFFGSVSVDVVPDGYIENTTKFDITPNDDGITATVKGFNPDNIIDTDDLSSVTIPDEICGYTITDIGEKAFAVGVDGAYKRNSEITSITIPDTVEVIGQEAFINNTVLSEVKLSANLKEIKFKAFGETSSLKTIELPHGLQKLGGQTFYHSGLETISLPDTVISMGSGEFRRCEKLKYVKLSAGVTSIPVETFVMTTCVIEELIIPASVTGLQGAIIDDYGKMNPKVYGEKGSFAETFAAEHEYDFVAVNGIVLASNEILGNGTKALEGTDYDIDYGFTSAYYTANLINIGSNDITATIYLAIYSPDGTLADIKTKTVEVKKSETKKITIADKLYLDNITLGEGTVIKSFLWTGDNNTPITKAKEIAFSKANKEIHVLAIGNSYCNDAFGYLNDVCEAGGVVIKAQNMFIGGAAIDIHYDNILEDRSVYEPRINGGNFDGEYTSISTALKSDKWDVVVLQAATHYNSDGKTDDYTFLDYETSGAAKKYEYIKNEVIKAAPADAIRMMHMSWTPANASAKKMYNGRYAGEENARLALFADQKEAYLYAAGIYSSESHMLVPTAEAINYAIDTLKFSENPEDARSMFRDETCHLNLPYGRTLAALTWYEYLTGNSAIDNPVKINGISDSDMALLKQAAHYACELPTYNK